MSQVPPGGRAAGVVDALKGTPLLLALVAVTLSLVGLLYYQASLQGEVQKLLSQCIVPPPAPR